MDWQKYETDFLSSFRSIREGTVASLLDLHFEAQISYFFELAPIQDSFRFRARHLGRRVASLLIDEKGDLQKDLLAQLNKQLEKGVFSLGPRREGDLLLYEHLQTSLLALRVKRKSGALSGNFPHLFAIKRPKR